MTPCSFYADQNQAAHRTACSAHGDCHPSECAEKLRKELKVYATALGAVLTHMGAPRDTAGQDIVNNAWGLYRKAAEDGVFMTR